MVQVLADPTVSQGANPAAVEGWRSDAKETSSSSPAPTPSREEHAQRMRELNLKRGVKRAPRRGWSLTDQQAQYDNGYHSFSSANTTIEHQSTIPENAVLPAPSTETAKQPQQSYTPIPRRPKVAPPRRSQSVTDCEPELSPGQPRPSGHMTLVDLPPELHFAIMDYLHPIDSVCLGLAHSRLYDIHRRKHGLVPLSSRYSGPNDIEWAWRGAGPLIRRDTSESIKSNASSNSSASTTTTTTTTTTTATNGTTATSTTQKDLEHLRVRGQVYCRKCGISRCELHRHLRDWFGEGYEYCEIKETYGAPAGPDAKSYCYLSSPKNRSKCGRHGPKRLAK